MLGFGAQDASNRAVQSFLTEGLVTVPSGRMSCTRVRVLRGHAYAGLHLQCMQALMCICVDESVSAGSVCVCLYACVCQCVLVRTVSLLEICMSVAVCASDYV